MSIDVEFAAVVAGNSDLRYYWFITFISHKSFID